VSSPDDILTVKLMRKQVDDLVGLLKSAPSTDSRDWQPDAQPWAGILHELEGAQQHVVEGAWQRNREEAHDN